MGAPWAQVLSLPCCPFQASPAPQEEFGQPASPTTRPHGAPTTYQGLLKLFHGNTPMEDLGAKGVSQEHGSIAEETQTWGVYQRVVLCLHNASGQGQTWAVLSPLVPGLCREAHVPAA